MYSHLLILLTFMEDGFAEILVALSFRKTLFFFVRNRLDHKTVKEMINKE